MLLLILLFAMVVGSLCCGPSVYKFLSLSTQSNPPVTCSEDITFDDEYGLPSSLTHSDGPPHRQKEEVKREDTIFRRRHLHPDDDPAATDFEGNLEDDDDEEEETGSVRQYDVVVVEEEKEDAKARS